MAAISKKNSEHYAWGGVCDGWHLLKSPVLSVIQERVPPSCFPNYKITCAVPKLQTLSSVFP